MHWFPSFNGNGRDTNDIKQWAAIAIGYHQSVVCTNTSINQQWRQPKKVRNAFAQKKDKSNSCVLNTTAGASILHTRGRLIWFDLGYSTLNFICIKVHYKFPCLNSMNFTQRISMFNLLFDSMLSPIFAIAQGLFASLLSFKHPKN